MITKEEAREEIARRQAVKSEKKQSVPTMLAEGQKGWATGLMHGLGQSIGDIGASAGNIPSELYQYFTGKEGYHIPHPDLINQEPKGLGETVGQEAGKAIPRLAFETLIANRLGSLGGRSGLARIGFGGLGGGLAGAAAQEGSRKQGAAEGIASGLVGGALTEYPLFQKQAARGYKQINKSVAKNDIGGFRLSPETHEQTNKLLKFSDLKPEREAIKEFAKDSKKGSYQNIHDFQSHLRTLSSDLFKEGKHRMAKRVSDLRTKILNDMKQNFNQQGYKNLTEKYERSQDLYRRHNVAKPYVKKILGTGALGGLFGGAASIPYFMATSKK